MHATLRRICTIDGDDPTGFRPTQPDRFAVILRLLVGPSPGNGEESFDVTVCTPLWLHDKCEREGILVGRHHIVVLGYDYEAIQSAISRLVERCSGPTWREIAVKVSRIAYWEFEDYQPAE